MKQQIISYNVEPFCRLICYTLVKLRFFQAKNGGFVFTMYGILSFPSLSSKFCGSTDVTEDRERRLLRHNYPLKNLSFQGKGSKKIANGWNKDVKRKSHEFCPSAILLPSVSYPSDILVRSNPFSIRPGFSALYLLQVTCKQVRV